MILESLFFDVLDFFDFLTLLVPNTIKIKIRNTFFTLRGNFYP